MQIRFSSTFGGLLPSFCFCCVNWVFSGTWTYVGLKKKWQTHTKPKIGTYRFHVSSSLSDKSKIEKMDAPTEPQRCRRDFRIEESFDSLLWQSPHNRPAPPKPVDEDVHGGFRIAKEEKKKLLRLNRSVPSQSLKTEKKHAYSPSQFLPTKAYFLCGIW